MIAESATKLFSLNSVICTFQFSLSHCALELCVRAYSELGEGQVGENQVSGYRPGFGKL